MPRAWSRDRSRDRIRPSRWLVGAPPWGRARRIAATGRKSASDQGSGAEVASGRGGTSGGLVRGVFQERGEDPVQVEHQEEAVLMPDQPAHELRAAAEAQRRRRLDVAG